MLYQEGEQPVGIFDALNKAVSALANTSLGTPLAVAQNTVLFNKIATEIIAAHGLPMIKSTSGQFEMPTVVHGKPVDLLEGVQDHSGIRTFNYGDPEFDSVHDEEENRSPFGNAGRQGKRFGFGKGISFGKSFEDENLEAHQAIVNAHQALERVNQLLEQQLAVSKLGTAAQTATATVVAVRPAATKMGQAELFDIDLAIGGDTSNLVHYLEIVHPDIRSRVAVGAQIAVRFDPQEPAIVWATW